MGRVTVTSPAAWLDCLACAGGRALARKAAIWQRSSGESVSLHAGDELLAIAYLVPDLDGRWEFCLSLRPPARPHMRELVRIAHLTLAALAQNRTVITHVTENNRSGVRMARLVGFRRLDQTLWIFDGERCDGSGEGSFRGRLEQGSEAGGGEKPRSAAGGERSPTGGSEPQ
ncbi:hypothetical protein G6M16_007465 [Agrobacterium tumefaciens]|nr:hypothetical protein G6M16_007465 [Agrobacterium tumefaciens]